MMNLTARVLAIAMLIAGAAQLGCTPSSRSAASPISQNERGTNAYALLVDGSIHPDTDGPPSGFFVRGTLSGRQFLPQGDVQGDGEFGKTGQPGWMELRDGAVHRAQEARNPVRPYIEGHTSDGTFRPDSRNIAY